MSAKQKRNQSEHWPTLPYKDWKETLDALHLWMQIIGKIKLAQNPFINHWWEVAFYVTPRGMTTGRIPYQQDAFEILFDFIDHKLIIQTSTGEQKVMKLKARSVKDFYKEFMQILASLGIKVKINTIPSEIAQAVPFTKDTKNRSYDKTSVTKWWKIQLQTSFILDQFRSDFRGKSSPVLFYWGSFDLNTARFSGKKLPDKKDWPNGYHFMRYAENEENFAVGFWPGNDDFPHPSFYSYIYPAPNVEKIIKTVPLLSYFNKNLSECILLYNDVIKIKNPEKEILNFFNTTYREFAKLSGWDIKELEGSTPNKKI